MAMEILTAIIPTIIDYTIRPVARQVGYIIFYKSNLEDLKSKLENFDSVKQRMKHEIDEVGRKVNQKVEADVQKWQSAAEKTTLEAEALLHDEGRAKTKCLIICSHLISCHQRSRKATKLMKKIEEHENKKKEFSSVAYEAPVEDISAIASDGYMAFESRISMVKDIITELKKPDINRIGVYGLGGVGKTTLAKEVYREAVKENLFDDVVIILDVKVKKDDEKIQKEITKRLGMDVDESEDMGKRANLLRARIKDGKTLVILDDVLERIDFEAVGLVGVPNCNLLLTSREKMHTQNDIQLGFLTDKESWSLFEKMAGDVVKDNRILKEATQLTKKCGGLPVLVVAVASALKDGSLQDWKDALRSFKRFAKKELEDKEFFALEWSYKQLEDQELQQLFLLCGILAAEGSAIYVFYLLHCAMGLGLVGSVETVEEARISLNGMVKKLKNSCLLLDGYDEETVRMHELVRDAAIRIATYDDRAFLRTYANEVKEWPLEDFGKKFTSMSLNGCKIPMLPEEPWECPELKLLILSDNYMGGSQEIPSKFFGGMKELKVLDVSGIRIPSLPLSLLSLKHLHTLCLDRCEFVDITLVGQLTNLRILSLLGSKFKELPREIGELTRLQLLDLTHCSELVLISPDVISSLTRLEDLRMGIKSFKQWEGEALVDGRRSNASVSELKHLSHLSALDMHIPDANLLPTNLFSDKLERYTILVGDCWEYPNIFATSSNMLKLKLTGRNQFDQGIRLLVKKCEQLYLDGMEIVNIISYLFKSEAVNQLKHFHVQNNDEVKYVIDSVNWSYSHNAFSCLESLALEDLVSLESVRYGQLIGESFRKLKSLRLRNLPKLIGFSSKGKQLTIATEADEIVKEDEVGGPSRLFNNGEVSMLTTLTVHGCDSLRFLFSSSVAKCLGQLKHVKISKCQALQLVYDTSSTTQVNGFECPNLNSVDIDSCDSLKNVFPASMAKNLKQLSKLKIKNCDLLEEIVGKKEGPETAYEEFEFPKVTFMELDNLPQLGSFYPGLHVSNWPSLNTLKFTKCGGVEIFAAEFSTYRDKSMLGHSRPTEQPFFLIEKVSMLTTLTVHGCDSLRFLFLSSVAKCLGQLKHVKISKCQALQLVYDTSSTTQVNGFECPNLNSVDIDSCDSLKNVFPASMAKNLKQLSKLKIKNCDLLEEIVGKKEGPETAYEEFGFPKVTFMEFDNLPQLRSFYPGLHVCNWPSLNTLKFTKCGGVEIFAAEFSIYQDKFVLGHPRPREQPFFLIEKDKSFLNLEYLVLDEKTEILNGPLPSELLRKLRVIDFATSHPKSDYFFENLQNIEWLHVLSAPWKELIVHDHQGSSSGEIHEVKTLPHVKGLWLGNMPELIHLGKENSQPGGHVFPNLEFLCLEKCGRLENLASTLISFRNLTTLTILDCHGLQYLIPYSVAKNLQHLKNLVVKSCENMVQIVASNENDSENEITFNCLKDLQLSGLPSLEGFCKGNCIFKVPSLPTLIVEDCRLIKLKISPDGLLQSDDALIKHDCDQTDQLMIADTNLDVTIVTPSTKEESSFFGGHVKFFRVCVIACLCVVFFFLWFFLLKEEISSSGADWKAL